MTFSILSQIKDAGLGSDGKTRVYVDDVIGVADLDTEGHLKVSDILKEFIGSKEKRSFAGCYVWATNRHMLTRIGSQ